MDHDVQLSQIERMVKHLQGLMAVDLGGCGGAHAKPVEREPGIPEELPRLMRCFDLVKASDEDCCKVLADLTTDDEDFGRMVLEWGAKVFVATRGSRGALVMTPQESYFIPPYQGRVMDPTGGGDTYFGGFLFAYLRTGDPEYAGRFGAATALCMIEETGGVFADRFPTLEMGEACMKRPQAEIVPLAST